MINDQSSIINYQSSFFDIQTHLQNIKKNERKKLSLEAREKKKLRKVSKWHQNVKKKERKKLSLEAREKKESSVKSLNAIKKSKRKSTWDFHIFFRKMGRAGFRARFRAGFRAGFYAKLELFRASRRFSLLQTLCTRRYEKRTQQAELVGKKRTVETKWARRMFGELDLCKSIG